MTNEQPIKTYVLNTPQENQPSILWQHLNYTDKAAKIWLKSQSQLSNQAINILLAADTRPRLIVENDAIIMCLRGINLNPNDTPEDMISIRIWMNAETLITSCNRCSKSIVNLQNQFEQGLKPNNVAQLLLNLIEQLALTSDEFVDSLDELLDAEEDTIAKSTFVLFNNKMSQLRR